MKNLIALIAERRRFAKKDVKEILDELVNVLEEHAVSGESITIHGLGTLKNTVIKERKGNDGKMLPTAIRTNFKLADNIRYANKRFKGLDKKE